MNLRPKQIAQEGATTGQALVWNGTLWAPASVAPIAARDRLVAASANTTLTLGATPVVNSELITKNGAQLWPTTDYTISGAVITFNTPLSVGDVITDRYLTANPSPGTAALSGGIVTYQQRVMADTPVVYFPFQEASGTPADAETSAHTFNLNSAVTVNQTGPLSGKSILLNGSTYGYITDATDLHFTGPVSVEFWVKTPSGATSGVFMAKATTAFGSLSERGIEVDMLSGTLYFFIRHASTTSNITCSASLLNNGGWHHVAATFDGTTGSTGMKLWIDGTLAASGAAAASAIASTTDNVKLGAAGGTNNFPIAMNMAHFAMYGAALTSTQVAYHYAATS